jgi:spore coat polysaccharide biosynthesis protein SpsF (cytidylyltransferase family)
MNTNEVAVILQVRASSTRLKHKYLLSIKDDESMLHYMIRNILPVANYTHFVVLAPKSEYELFREHEYIEHFSFSLIPVENVMGRFLDYLLNKNIKFVIRITGDCPLLTADHLYDFHSKVSTTFNTITTNRPLDADGFDMEAFNILDLLRFYDEANEYQREHVTSILYEKLNVTRVKCVYGYDARKKYSIDTQEDLDFVRSLL